MDSYQIDNIPSETYAKPMTMGLLNSVGRTGENPRRFHLEAVSEGKLDVTFPPTCLTVGIEIVSKIQVVNGL